MKTQKTTTVSEFIVRNVSKDLVEGLTVLSGLNFPIHDKYSFDCALKECSTEQINITMLTHSFTPQDFPIFSAENSFEKYLAKFQPFPYPFPLFPLPPVDLQDFRQTPSVCDVYRDTFRENVDAANCACRAYSEARREGFNHLQATLIGHFAGRRFVSTDTCSV